MVYKLKIKYDRNNMLRLTELGREIYGQSIKIEIISDWSREVVYGHRTVNSHNVAGVKIMASNPLELKALIDMGLVEIR